MSTPKEVQVDVARLVRLFSNIPASSTVPLFIDHNGYTMPHATGTLLSVGSLYFLVTAAHAVKDAAADGSPLFVGGVQGANVLPLRGHMINAPTNSKSDIAAYCLPHDDLRIYESKRFLGLSDFWIDPRDPGTGPFALYGFFADPRGAGGEDMPRGYVNSAYLFMNRYVGNPPSDGYDAPLHLLFDGKPRHNFGEGGAPKSLPASEYRGISGAGLFTVSPDDQRPLLVAIETCVHRDNNIVQGTRVCSLVELLGSKYAEVREAVEQFCRSSEDSR